MNKEFFLGLPTDEDGKLHQPKSHGGMLEFNYGKKHLTTEDAELWLETWRKAHPDPTEDDLAEALKRLNGTA